MRPAGTCWYCNTVSTSAINIKGVKIKTKFLYERDSLNIDDMKDVAAIIVECSSETSSPNRTHPLFPPSNGNTKSYDKPTLAYLDQLDSLHKAGMGIMILHWGIAVGNQKAANYYLSWFGENGAGRLYSQSIRLLDSNTHKKCRKTPDPERCYAMAI